MNNELEPLPDLTEFKKHPVEMLSRIKRMFELKTEIANAFEDKEKLKYIGARSPFIKKLTEFDKEEFNFSELELEAIIDSVKYGNDFIVQYKGKFDEEENLLYVTAGLRDADITAIFGIEFSEEEQFYINRHYEICNYVRIYNDGIGIALSTTEMPEVF